MPDLIQGLIVLSLLEVQLPLGGVGVGRFPNLDVTTDGGLAGLTDMDQTLFPMFVGGQGLEKSFLRPRWSDVLSIDPATRLVSVATYGPFPERLADPVVDALEDLLADNMSVVVGPAPDDRVVSQYAPGAAARFAAQRPSRWSAMQSVCVRVRQLLTWLPMLSSCVPSVERITRFSCDETPDGSQPTFVGGEVTPIRPITGWHSLFPSSFTRIPIGSPCGLLSQREEYGLTTFHMCTRMG
jgi:hypothetical protein